MTSFKVTGWLPRKVWLSLDDEPLYIHCTSGYSYSKYNHMQFILLFFLSVGRPRTPEPRGNSRGVSVILDSKSLCYPGQR